MRFLAVSAALGALITQGCSPNKSTEVPIESKTAGSSKLEAITNFGKTGDSPLATEASTVQAAGELVEAVPVDNTAIKTHQADEADVTPHNSNKSPGATAPRSEEISV